MKKIVSLLTLLGLALVIFPVSSVSAFVKPSTLIDKVLDEGVGSVKSLKDRMSLLRENIQARDLELKKGVTDLASKFTEDLEKEKKAILKMVERKLIPVGDQYVLTLKWGDLDNSVEQGIAKTDWQGVLQISGAEMRIKEAIKFEKIEDSFTRNAMQWGKGFKWTSKISSHYDGLEIQVKKEKNIKLEEVKLTLSYPAFGGKKLYNYNLVDLLKKVKVENYEKGYKSFLGAKSFKDYRKWEIPNTMLEFKWGNISGEKNELKNVEYKGEVEVEGGKINLVKSFLFEEGDNILTQDLKKINWNSLVNGHVDGFLLKVTPYNENDSDTANGMKEKKLMIKMNDLSILIDGSEDFKKYDLGNGHELQIRNHLPVNLNLSDELKNKLIKEKGKVMVGLEKFDQELKNLKAKGFGWTDDKVRKLTELREDVAEYNFGGNLEDEVKIKLENLAEILGAAALTKAQMDVHEKLFRENLEKIKSQAKLLKFYDKLIPFKDTDDNEWFTKYVGFVKDKNIVGGYKDENGKELGEFRPGNNVTIAEILKIALKSAGIDEENSLGVPVNKKAINHWGEKFVRRSEELGLDLVKNSDDNPDRQATRGEVIRLILESFGVDPGTELNTGFKDVPLSHKMAKWINFGKEQGLISGDDGKNTFRPDASINRAEVAKIIQKAIETFGDNLTTEIEDVLAEAEKKEVDKNTEKKELKVPSIIDGTLEISLDGNPTTGFKWMVDYDKDLFRLEKSDYVPSAEEGVVGSGGKWNFVFTPLKFGEHEITFTYSRPWESVAPLKETVYQVNVDR